MTHEQHESNDREHAMRERMKIHGIELVRNPDGTWNLMKRQRLGWDFACFDDVERYANIELRSERHTDPDGKTTTFEECELFAQWDSISTALCAMTKQGWLPPNNLRDIIITMQMDLEELAFELKPQEEA
jgi:hypothetical protein